MASRRCCLPPSLDTARASAGCSLGHFTSMEESTSYSVLPLRIKGLPILRHLYVRSHVGAESERAAFVTGLPACLDEGALLELFTRFGEVRRGWHYLLAALAWRLQASLTPLSRAAETIHSPAARRWSALHCTAPSAQQRCCMHRQLAGTHCCVPPARAGCLRWRQWSRASPMVSRRGWRRTRPRSLVTTGCSRLSMSG